MRYCPNCSAYQTDENSDHCAKCGYDFKAHIENLNRNRKETEIENKKSEKQRMEEFDEELPCPLCGEPSRLIDENIDIEHEGKRIEIYGVKLMGGDITKKTTTLFRMRVTGLRCASDHNFFIDVSDKRKALCPVCTDPLIEYGSSLYSCTRCNRHFPMNEWEIPSAEAVLIEKGWYKAD